MDSNHIDRTSVTLTVARQTPKNDFGQMLKSTLGSAAQLGGQVLGGLTGMPIVSAAVSGVTALAGGSAPGTGRSAQAAQASSGVIQIGTGRSAGGVVGIAGGGATPGALPNGLGGTGSGITPGTSGSVTAADPANFDTYLNQMRIESDRSMAMQVEMQQESREYNTLSNVLKLRHDSAKAAINNIR